MKIIGHFQAGFFFFNDTATTEIYTLSLHDALPISGRRRPPRSTGTAGARRAGRPPARRGPARSEEHTSELQSRQYLVCRLLLEKKKNMAIAPNKNHFISSSLLELFGP